MPRKPDEAKIHAFSLAPNGPFPNNDAQPALLFAGAFAPEAEDDLEEVMRTTFEENGWTNGWSDSIFDYHHYHTTAHEVLGCYQGQAEVMLGGPGGTTISLSAGDVLVLSAGTSHKRVQGSEDFRVVGCYAGGQDYDMKLGRPEERFDVERNLSELEIPERDPVWGTSGPLFDHWAANE